MRADRRRRELRGAVLLPLAAWALHQLRYDLWFGGGAHRALATRGHAYMAGLEPLLVGFAAALAGIAVVRVARAFATGTTRGPATRRRPSTGRVALAAAAALLAVFVLQESLESLLATGHPGGLAAVTADGGWIALPLALALGGVVALLVRGGEIAVRLAARAGATRRPRPAGPGPAAARIRPFLPLPRLPVLAGSAAGRAPPRAASPLLPTG